MRRLVLLGLLGLGVSACKKDEPVDPGQQETPLCPDLVVQTRSPSSQALATASSALRSTSTSQDGSERVLVRFRKQTGVHAAAVSRQREDKVRAVGARLKSHWPSLDTLALTVTPEQKARLAQDPEVLSISEDRKVHALGLSPWVPVSALLAAPATTGSTSEYTWAVKMTQANEVWDANNDGVLDAGAPNGSGRTVCVIDSGIDPDHPELKAAYAGGKDFIDLDDVPEDKDSSGAWGGGHGTHVSGTIAAQLGSGGQVNPNDTSLSTSGMVGLAPGVRLLVARVLDENGDGRTSDVIDALRWCVAQKANVVSLSLGSPTPDETEKQAFQEAWDAGLLSVAASGNGGEIATPDSRIYPAAYDTVLAVGAVDANGKHPTFSQGGPHLSLVAPGVGVYSTFPRGKSPYANLVAGGTFYASSALDFVPFEEYEGKLLNCGLGDGMRSCPEATCDGFVAYVDRGDIKFNEKVRNVRSQGARAVIIGNNNPEDDASLGFTLGVAGAWPPVTAITTTVVPAVRAQFGNTVRVGIRGGDYAFSSGTSMATPHVSAVAALVWSARPSLTNQQVRDILESTAKRLEDSNIPGTDADRDDVFGWGLVQAKAAVDKALSMP
ncbi:S8 family serine peptidase [Vitiosangium sp. GDMCC 1.1324]|uniref:S8 family serine peptidase n=1 Tax=Vitiosangium sp. (strain GDMCC 1.1324) TaxID=2138576 RepID=UPI000D36013B|nr:S8 family serine peptidase [Vitiosangium sp. GDMCC 1.1324]PTL76782.1 peptidase S8 [Vitiosangium sp. GDMCC 1.1324]